MNQQQTETFSQIERNQFEIVELLANVEKDLAIELYRRIDDNFKLFIESAKIQKAIDAVSIKLNNNYAQKSPIFVCILNGSFMFASDLIRTFTDNCEVTFLKVASYDGTKSTGSVKELIGLNESITGRDVIIVEDIVDTGATLEVVIKDLNLLNPKSIKVSTLLYKPLAYKM